MRSYEEIFELGRGGMGVVFLACGRGAGGFQNLVVIKRLHPHLTTEAKSVKRFLNEAKVAALIHHANVVGTHYVGEDERGYFLVIDYVEGLSLDDLCERARQRGMLLPVAVVLRIGLDALAGLTAVHDAADPGGQRLNLLHRDVSPHNLLVGRDGVTRLADFGVARSDLHRTTERQYLFGKLCYLPREYLRREELWPNSDVYSLSVSLWTALLGHEPWPDADEVHLLRHIVDDRLPPPSSEREVSPLIDAVFARGTDPDRASRYRSAREMADAIEDAMARGERVATAREVADLVSALAGRELSDRAERVAAWFAERSSVPPPSGESEVRVSQRPTPIAPTETIAPARGRSRLVWSALAALSILGAAAAFAAHTLQREQQEPTGAVGGGAATPPAVTVSVVDTPPALVQSGAEPEGPAPVPPGPESGSAAVKPARRAPATQVPQRPAQERLPSKITTKNPYRD